MKKNLFKMQVKNWNLEFTKNNKILSCWIDDGCFQDKVIFYGGGLGYASDFPEKIPKYIKKILKSVKY